MVNFVITAIALLGVAILIIATDFWLLWLPIAHSEQYPSKMAALFMAVTAWVTLWVVLAAFRTIKQRDNQEKRDRKERLLNEIIEWATDVRKYASIPHIIDHNSNTLMRSADRFFTLKYNGKKFLIAVKKQAIGDDLQSLLSNAIEFLENNWRDFATKPDRRDEIVKDLDKIGEAIIEKAADLLLSNS